MFDSVKFLCVSVQHTTNQDCVNVFPLSPPSDVTNILSKNRFQRRWQCHATCSMTRVRRNRGYVGSGIQLIGFLENTFLNFYVGFLENTFLDFLSQISVMCCKKMFFQISRKWFFRFLSRISVLCCKITFFQISRKHFFRFLSQISRSDFQKKFLKNIF